MRIVFMGTPGFAATILENIAPVHEVVAVFTRPDAVRGRGGKTVASPVKRVAQNLGLPVFTPHDLRAAATVDHLTSLRPDCICVAAYGVILPASVLAVPPYGCLNVHASLLPKLRGAAPIERAIMDGDEKAGVSIMRMEEGLDTGDYCLVRSTEIADKTTTQLTAELSDLGSTALLSALLQLESGTSIDWQTQDDLYATYADKIEPHEFFLHIHDRPRRAVRKVQASSAAHPSRCTMASRGVTVIRMAMVDPDFADEHLKLLKPGHMMLAVKRLFMCFDDGPVEVLELRPDGKRTMSAAEFAAGVQNIKSGLITWESLDD